MNTHFLVAGYRTKLDPTESSGVRSVAQCGAARGRVREVLFAFGVAGIATSVPILRGEQDGWALPGAAFPPPPCSAVAAVAVLGIAGFAPPV